MKNYTPKKPAIIASQIMVPIQKLVTLPPEMDAIKAIQILLKNKISGAPVLTPNGEFLGVFSEKCSMKMLIDASYEELPSNRVEAFMDTDIKRIITPDHDLLAVAEIFLLTPYRRLPVLEGKKLVGQVSRRDVLSAAMKRLSEVEAESGEKKTLLYLSALMERNEAPVS